MFDQNTLRKISSVRDEDNNVWISEEEFSVVFPTGYRKCNFFSSPCEFFSMDREAFERHKKSEPLIPLSSIRTDQIEFQIKHLVDNSSDSSIFLDLLKEDKYIQSRLTRSREDGPQQKKMKIDFDTAVVIEKLKNSFITNCYICGNVCNCCVLKSMSQRGPSQSVSLISQALPNLPDIELIDNFDNISLKLITPFDRHKLLLSDIEKNRVLDNGDESAVSDLEDIVDDNLSETTEVYSEPSNIDQDDIDLVNEYSLLYKTYQIDNSLFDTSSPVEGSTKECADTEGNEEIPDDIKNYFHLNKISDLFYN